MFSLPECCRFLSYDIIAIISTSPHGKLVNESVADRREIGCRLHMFVGLNRFLVTNVHMMIRAKVVSVHV